MLKNTIDEFLNGRIRESHDQLTNSMDFLVSSQQNRMDLQNIINQVIITSQKENSRLQSWLK
jgi:hypothetical protein